IRGQVLDQQSETPLIGATVQVLNLETGIGASTDMEGHFVLKNVPVGRQTLRVSYLGYEPQTLPNVLLTAGKEVVLTIKLVESFTAMEEVVVVAQVNKDKAINDLATISARQFNTEEVSRYSGGRNDIGRLVANFAGVAASNDARNDIVIRGNSPTGVLWRLEGIPIPNPNHYATLGTTGGPVSALNPNMIGNSDFLTSAFPAEYGNATAGVFDINLRTGNKDRFEFMGQLGAFTGLEAATEGPIRKGKGSFVLAYRHSFAEIASWAGLNVGTTATPKYKDLTFNLDFGTTHAGKFSLFGIGGYSNIDFLGAEIDTTDLFANPNENAYNISKFGVIGLKHHLLLNERSYLRTVISATHSGNSYLTEDLEMRDANNALLQMLDVQDAENTFRLSSFYNLKMNRRFTLRSGVLLQEQLLDTYTKTRVGVPDADGDGLPDWFTQRAFDGHFTQAEAYAQTQWRITQKLTLNTGVHGLYFGQTADVALEPRVAINWQFAPKSTLNIGYGMHHQTQPLPVFLFRERLPDGSAVETNKDLGFTRSQHFVVGWDFKPATSWRIKTEAYYQDLSKIPVESSSSSFSLLNSGADFAFPEKNNLVNKGTGSNIGIELTAEKFFSQGWYSLVTVSLFDSKYKGSDDVKRSTAFDGGYVANILAGKEFKLGKSGRRFLTLDTKLTTAGGRPYTPVDLAASQAAGREILLEDQAFSLRLGDYFRWDVKIGYRKNSTKRKLSETFFLDFQNVTNRQNIFATRYNEVRNEIGKTYQIGFFPDVMYRVEF
ncbi:MAG: carboxypeptidase-like regulatory domain-containing protein, partial [Saprospiraceae bacterium]|nr:carboxypeptidase-like regulatory domain-containing protein [Saprospiraceae bacterium]